MSDHCHRVFYECSYNTSNHFLSADKVEILLSMIVFSSINSSHSIFKSMINSVSISQSVTQSLTLSSVISLFTVNLFISVLLQIIADSFILKIFILSVFSAAL
ncbi:hypothetical protein EMPG_13796 [Blastomyces silverae]|uniref:Uncharacterized protein n=1 Tax=Blastomyces silverae TaxID=2060906 RepID=A0A0H1BNY0_9EURO|nr:hypothetical protein EMPG_13796 [Blastomyces silverae]